MTEYLKEEFQLEDQDLRTYSPLTLAYIGDSIFDLVIRTLLVKQGTVRRRNCMSVHQSSSKLLLREMIENLMPVLSEEEITIYKRGRNAKSYTKSKKCNGGRLPKATGLEALMGYLYLKKRIRKRIIETDKEPVLIWQIKVRKERSGTGMRYEKGTYHRRKKCRAGSISFRKTGRQAVCTGRLSGRSR